MNDACRFKFKCPGCGHRWKQTMTGRGDMEPQCPKCFCIPVVEGASATAELRIEKQKVNIR